MITLKNIKRNNDLIECDILPEDSSKLGHIVVNLELKDIIKYNLPEGYEWCKNHVYHALTALLEMSLSLVLPNEKLIMWN